MKKNHTFRLIAVVLTMTVLIGIAGVFGASAAGSIFVNNSSNVLSGSLSAAYAIGSGGAIGTVYPGASLYTITGSGLQTLGGTMVEEEIDESYGETSINIRTETVKIGLKYYYSDRRDSSVESASISNYVGNGFKFGYYDANRKFQEVGYTTEHSLLLVKDTNVSVSAGTVGCYHIRLGDTYYTFEDALAASYSYSGGFPAYYNGLYYVLVGNYTSADEATAAAAAAGITGTAYSASNRCVAVVKPGTTQILFEFDCGSSHALAIEPISEGEKAVTSFADNRYYGGFEFLRYGGKNMTVINYVAVEDYVKGVIPYEMSSSWPLEALKAQAVCARTYVIKRLNTYSSYGFDITNDTYSQVYRGLTSANSTTDRAVEETANLYATYNGAFCDTVYFSSDGGATESSENIWSTAYPYLVGKIDPYEEAIDFPNKSWRYEYTPVQITSILKGNGYTIGTIADIIPEYSASGNMIKLSFVDTSGKTVTVTKRSCANALNLLGIHFTIDYDAVSGKYIIDGGGWGHNVGMSQWGAFSMAKEYGYSFVRILKFYYTGIDISIGVSS